MATQISTAAANAFYYGRNFKMGNTEVCTFMDGGVELHLHGNLIALYNKHTNRQIRFTLHGYNTKTTRERLRALGIDVKQKAGKILHGSTEINATDFYDSGLFA